MEIQQRDEQIRYWESEIEREKLAQERELHDKLEAARASNRDEIRSIRTASEQSLENMKEQIERGERRAT